jgi:hypothetical protein
MIIFRTYNSGRSMTPIRFQRAYTRISTSWTTSSARARSAVSTPAKRSTPGSRVAANSSNVIAPPSWGSPIRKRTRDAETLCSRPYWRARQPGTLNAVAITFGDRFPAAGDLTAMRAWSPACEHYLRSPATLNTL